MNNKQERQKNKRFILLEKWEELATGYDGSCTAIVTLDPKTTCHIIGDKESQLNQPIIIYRQQPTKNSFQKMQRNTPKYTKDKLIL